MILLSETVPAAIFLPVREGSLMEQKREFKEISLEGAVKIGEGAHAEVFRISEDTIAKVYRPLVTLDAIKKEKELSRWAFAKGNEGITQTAQRAHWQAVLKSDGFNTIVKNSIWGIIKDLPSASAGEAYPLLTQALKTSLKPAEGNIVTITTSGSSTYLTLLNYLLGSVNTPETLVSLLNTAGMNPIPDTLASKVGNMLAEMQLAMTVDTNIPQDSEWEFHTVLFYPENGTQNIVGTLTVEDYKAGYLPKVSRSDYRFTG